MSAELLGIMAVMTLPMIGLCVTLYLSYIYSGGDDG
jgi:hypothetical protein